LQQCNICGIESSWFNPFAEPGARSKTLSSWWPATIANTIKSNQPLGEEVLIGHFAEDPSDLRGGTSEKQDFDGIGIDGKFEEVAAGQPVLAFKVADEYLRRRARCRDSGEKRVAVG